MEWLTVHVVEPGFSTWQFCFVAEMLIHLALTTENNNKSSCFGHISPNHRVRNIKKRKKNSEPRANVTILLHSCYVCTVHTHTLSLSLRTHNGQLNLLIPFSKLILICNKRVVPRWQPWQSWQAHKLSLKIKVQSHEKNFSTFSWSQQRQSKEKEGTRRGRKSREKASS